MPTETLTDIPLIDFAPFLTDDFAGQQQVAHDIFEACHKFGFLYLKNHGIPQAAIARTFEQSQAFFALPLAKKQRVAWSSESSNRGYVGIERERLDETQPGDLKEAFNVGREASTAVTQTDQGTPGLNQWPVGHEIFKQTVREFFELCTGEAKRVLRAFAIALSLPPNYLTQRHQTCEFTLRLLHYPPVTKLPKPGQIRAGAHSDYGTLTLLFQDGVGGLEVLNAQDEWVAAPAIPGAILVNTGDLMQRWTNDLFRSTQHRVRLASEEGRRSDRASADLSVRYSIAFFCEPDAETEITCLPTCQSQENLPRYSAINAREYLLSRLRATY